MHLQGVDVDRAPSRSFQHVCQRLLHPGRIRKHGKRDKSDPDDQDSQKKHREANSNNPGRPTRKWFWMRHDAECSGYDTLGEEVPVVKKLGEGSMGFRRFFRRPSCDKAQTFSGLLSSLFREEGIPARYSWNMTTVYQNGAIRSVR
jgi:hypothetical protein